MTTRVPLVSCEALANRSHPNVSVTDVGTETVKTPVQGVEDVETSKTIETDKTSNNMSSYVAVPAPTQYERTLIVFLRQEVPPSMADPNDIYFLSNTDEGVNEFTYLRFIRMNDGKKKETVDSLKKCIEWRKKEKPYSLLEPNVIEKLCPISLKSDFVNVGGLDKKGRRIVIAKVGKPNKSTVEERVKLFTYVMETVMTRREYVTTFSDFSNVKLKHIDSVAKTARERCGYIMGNYYPELCQITYFYKAPWYVNTMANVFLDAKCKSRLRTASSVRDLRKDIDLSELPTQYEGGRFVMGETCKDTFDYLFEKELCEKTASQAVNLCDLSVEQSRVLCECPVETLKTDLKTAHPSREENKSPETTRALEGETTQKSPEVFSKNLCDDDICIVGMPELPIGIQRESFGEPNKVSENVNSVIIEDALQTGKQRESVMDGNCISPVPLASSQCSEHLTTEGPSVWHDMISRGSTNISTRQLQEDFFGFTGNNASFASSEARSEDFFDAISCPDDDDTYEEVYHETLLTTENALENIHNIYDGNAINQQEGNNSSEDTKEIKHTFAVEGELDTDCTDSTETTESTTSAETTSSSSEDESNEEASSTEEEEKEQLQRKTAKLSLRHSVSNASSHLLSMHSPGDRQKLRKFLQHSHSEFSLNDGLTLESTSQYTEDSRFLYSDMSGNEALMPRRSAKEVYDTLYKKGQMVKSRHGFGHFDLLENLYIDE